MITTGERYHRFSLGLTNGQRVTTEDPDWTHPIFAVLMDDHIQVVWTNRDITLYPMSAVVAFIVHSLADDTELTTQGEQP